MTFFLNKRALGLLCIPILSGCTTLGYYFDAIGGHLDLINRQQPVTEILQQPNIAPGLREQLVLSQKAREFASKELLLPDNDSYRSYSDIGRPYAVWNVIAVPALSIQPKKWCFVFAGCISYRGYFTHKAAERYAAEFKAQGFDVHVAGAWAYSTLGWFDDPLLNTMFNRGEAALVGTLFHELAHQLLYIDDDSAFNESFASFVEMEGLRRWFLAKRNNKAYDAYLKKNQRSTEFRGLLKNTRENLKNIYSSNLAATKKITLKQEAFTRLKLNYEKLKQNWGGDDRYDAWMAQELNNAHLALMSTYHQKVPAFVAILAENKGDLAAFYKAVKRLADLPGTERQVLMERKINVLKEF